MIDGEGCVYVNELDRKRIVSIYNTDLQLIEACESAAQLLGVKFRRRTPKMRPCNKKQPYILEASGRANLLLLGEALNLQGEKKEKLRQLVASYSKIDNRLPRDCWPIEELFELKGNGRTGKELAGHFGVSEATISYWIKQTRNSVES